MKEILKKHQQYLLTGVSYVIPFIACGGILVAAGISLAPMAVSGDHLGPDFSHSPKLQLIMDIGGAAFTLALPVLAGFIAYGMASKPGLVPGMVGGYLAANVKAGFLGALVAGLLAGHVVMLLKKLPVHKLIRPIMPVILIPVSSSLIVGLVMLAVIGAPIAHFMDFLGEWLKSMNQGNAVLLAAILGAMIAFDMGGPVNKAAFFFGTAMIQQGNYAVMGACAAAICIPPLGMGLATVIKKKLWTEEQREAGLAALGMGLIGITEGAIPFAAADPFRVIPAIMLGSMCGSTVAMLGHVGDHAPHGGPIVIFAVESRFMYVIAIITGMIVTAAAITMLKTFTEKAPLAAAPAKP